MEIQRTNDYTIFKKHAGNRPLNTSNVHRITESIRTKNLLEFRPILVNRDMQVVDGQHRLEAAKILKVPIYWSMLEESNSASEADIVLLNANQKNWDLSDYLNYYQSKSLEDYVEMARFMKKNNLTLNTSLSLIFGGGAAITSNFKSGLFKFPKNEYPEIESKLQKINKFIELVDLKSFGEKKYLKSPRFFRAISCFLNIKDVDFEVFMKRVEFKLDHLRPCARLLEFMEIFKEIYNFNNRNPINLMEALKNSGIISGH